MKDSMTREKRLYLLMQKVIPVVLDRIDKEVPERGRFTPIAVCFDIPLTDNEARIVVESSVTGVAQQRRLSLSVRENGSDRLHSYYLLHDTNEKIKEYLMADGTVETLVRYCQELSDKVDNDD